MMQDAIGHRRGQADVLETMIAHSARPLFEVLIVGERS
jgi:hypothetical protein